MTYIESLNALKCTLLGGSERQILVNAIRDHFTNKRISMLDVGCGDGDSLNKILRVLQIEYGYEVNVTAIDPLLDKMPQAKTNLPNATLVSNIIENYKTNKLYDFVNATQSLYYMPNKTTALRKMIALTKPRGLIIVTLCSKDCILSRLHFELYGIESPYWTTAEDAVNILKREGGIKECKLEYFHGSINLLAWKTDPNILNQAYEIISRLSSSNITPSKDSKKLRIIINKYKDIEPRVNGVIIATKNFL